MSMKNSIMMLVFSILSGYILVGICYGQTTGASTDDSIVTGAVGAKGLADSESTGAQSTKNPPQVLMQLQLRDAKGHLLAYIEGTRIVSLKPVMLNQYLDTIPGKQIIMKEGKMYELIQFQRPEPTVVRSHSMAMFVLMARIDDKNQNVLMINHDAYQVEPGDTATVYWTITRSVQ